MRSQTFLDLDVRIDSLIYLPSELAHEDHSAAFIEFCEDFTTNLNDPILKSLPELKRFIDPDIYVEAYDIADELLSHGRGGFILEVVKPVLEVLPSGHRTYNWGYLHLARLYAANEDAFISVVSAWAEEMEKLDKGKADDKS